MHNRLPLLNLLLYKKVLKAYVTAYLMNVCTYYQVIIINAFLLLSQIYTLILPRIVTSENVGHFFAHTPLVLLQEEVVCFIVC